jgi:hypothetical protein
VLLGCFMNLCNLIKCIENICIVNSKHVLFRLAEFATAVAVQVFVVQVQVFLVQRQRRGPDSWRRTSGGRARPCRNRAGPPPSHLHPFEKHGESNTTEAAARETTTATATATATRMIGRGVRRGDPGGAEGDNRKWAATRSMIRGDGTRPRLPAWIFVPSSPPYLSPPAWIFPDSLPHYATAIWGRRGSLRCCYARSP